MTNHEIDYVAIADKVWPDWVKRYWKISPMDDDWRSIDSGDPTFNSKAEAALDCLTSPDGIVKMLAWCNKAVKKINPEYCFGYWGHYCDIGRWLDTDDINCNIADQIWSVVRGFSTLPEATAYIMRAKEGK